jgi:alpha-D-ribose 1-methylphosphonate 5-triphosphate diphosphatase
MTRSGCPAGRIAGGASAHVSICRDMVLPGIVDIHGDGFERHLAPRRGALESLAAGWEPRRGACGQRDHDRRDRPVLLLGRRDARPGLRRGAGGGAAGTPMRAETMVQLRLEIGMIDDFDRVLALVDRGRHPLRRVERPPAAQGACGGQAAAEPDGAGAEGAPLARGASRHAAGDARPLGGGAGGAVAALRGVDRPWVLIGSHDDNTAEDRQRGRALGATVSEFPETMEAAEAARAAGEGVIMGAPNLVRGGPTRARSRRGIWWRRGSWMRWPPTITTPRRRARRSG